jgi:hypothetical protein
MDLTFRTRKLEKLANSEKEQLKQLGKNAAKKLNAVWTISGRPAIWRKWLCCPGGSIHSPGTGRASCRWIWNIRTGCCSLPPMILSRRKATAAWTGRPLPQSKSSKSLIPMNKNPQTTNTYLPDRVSPPGGTLEDVLEERGMTQAELSERAGLSKKPSTSSSKARLHSHRRAPCCLRRRLGFQRVSGSTGKRTTASFSPAPRHSSGSRHSPNGPGVFPTPPLSKWVGSPRPRLWQRRSTAFWAISQSPIQTDGANSTPGRKRRSVAPRSSGTRSKLFPHGCGREKSERRKFARRPIRRRRSTRLWPRSANSALWRIQMSLCHACNSSAQTRESFSCWCPSCLRWV